jgi:hypothetical protein
MKKLLSIMALVLTVHSLGAMFYFINQFGPDHKIDQPTAQAFLLFMQTKNDSLSGVINSIKEKIKNFDTINFDDLKALPEFSYQQFEELACNGTIESIGFSKSGPPESIIIHDVPRSPVSNNEKNTSTNNFMWAKRLICGTGILGIGVCIYKAYQYYADQEETQDTSQDTSIDE